MYSLCFNGLGRLPIYLFCSGIRTLSDVRADEVGTQARSFDKLISEKLGCRMGQNHAKTDQLPDLNELLMPSDENQRLLRQKIKQLRSRPDIAPNIKTKELILLLGEVPGCGNLTGSKMDNFINSRTRLPKACYQALLREIWDRGWWAVGCEQEGMANDSDFLFHALVDFLGAKTQTLRNLTVEIPGTYVVWRASLHCPGSYVRGRMTITCRADTGVLWVEETHAFQGDRDANPIEETFEGYLVKKSRYYFLISRQKKSHSGLLHETNPGSSPVIHRGPPRVTVIQNTLYDDDRITAMYGIVIGTYGNNALFSAPIYVERASEGSNKEHSKEPAIIPGTEVSPAIRAKLDVHLIDGVLRF